MTGEPGVNDPAFWRALYTSGQDGWDLGRPSPTLGAHLERSRPSAGTVAVPGCGRGHDCRLLAARGYRVWGFDFAPEAIEAARTLAAPEGPAVTFELRDVFTLAEAYPAKFDGVWEYTCFCAIDPARRAEYVGVLAAILRPGGWLLAGFYPIRDGGGGPPFPVREAEVRRLLDAAFEIVDAYVPADSPPGRTGRSGQEWMVTARRRPAP